ncbi:hypothetical protein [Mycetocola saprophilus]|uniref:hypothetical protein n=1 Tax=Mycetocola saprophilus TaxID=76636 RepID=UPI003BF2CCB1
MSSDTDEESLAPYGRWKEVFGTEVVDSPPDQYSRHPVGKVTFARIVQDGPSGIELVGFIWFDDEEFAAGYLPARSNIPVGVNAAAVWGPEIDQGFVRGIAPSVRYAELVQLDFGYRIGRIDGESLSEIGSLAELRTLAKSVPYQNIS